MAYQINSGKDSHGDEQIFMQKFATNRAAIEAYKRTHGGDLESAYQAVVGQPWPAGRSVKIHNGMPEMTKDRTVKSVMGKYVAPIGAAALTALTAGGAAPALAGMFGGGGTAAGATGVVGSGMAAAAPASIIGSTVGATGVSAAGSGVFGTLAGLATKPTLDMAGRMISRVGEASASNRGAQIAAGLDRDRINVDRSQEERAVTDDAWTKLQQASYLKNRTAGYQAPMLHGKQMFDPGFGYKASTAAEVQGAGTLEDEMKRRLANAGRTLPQGTDVDRLSHPGVMERIANFAGPMASIYGTMRR